MVAATPPPEPSAPPERRSVTGFAGSGGLDRSESLDSSEGPKPVTDRRSPGATESPAEIPIFDRAGLLERVMNDTGMLRVLIAGFLADLPGDIRQLQAFAAAGEARKFGEQAHKIKSGCAGMGGEALRALAEVLEQAGKAGDLATIAARLPEVDAQVAALQEAMKDGL